MSNSVFLTLAFLIVGGIVFYKSNEQKNFPTPVLKKIKKAKKITRPTAVTTPAPTSLEAPQVNETKPDSEPSPASAMEPRPSTPQTPAVSTTQNTVVYVPSKTSSDTYFEVLTNLNADEKIKDLYKLARHYRFQIEEIYKNKKLFYEEGNKVDSLLSDSAEYINEPDDYTKESDPQHINDLKEFMNTVYRLRDEGNKRALESRK